ncbi:hypothetical protein C266_22966 [Pandoraea sp. SD6-2]|nr:hypothetical protein C266_22966 [Pandoraea sp. SD6-2]
MYQALDFSGHLIALLAQGGQLLCQTRHDQRGGMGGGHNCRLFGQSLRNVSSQAFANARRELDEAVGEGFLAGGG